MKRTKREDSAELTLAGYEHGFNAPLAAADTAYQRSRTAHTIVFVEGISDQIAVETLAARQNLDLEAKSIVVFPVGGSKSVTRYLREFGPMGARKTLAGLCDTDAAGIFSRALFNTGHTEIRSPDDLPAAGFFVCDRYLEEELIRAIGPGPIVDMIVAQGEGNALSIFQKQPEWRDRDLSDQLCRFFRSKARRPARYARLLIEACPPDRIPRPLSDLVAHVS
ncbi:TOPRIM nucleotidyl transferase/hydrolase domain-containing protein [Pelagibacterium luteolum]|uniref:OLD protein-like TOPRIM domain-containing protein n=1 Tax=Pelagibacterium luteolum TaxID=440168 RepID=A0A1G7UI71_9HYPH|nr:TOPRIM nucleotidyl transferase/hydrolase domain-containing protein [Pelagibacterium luteolum]SDG47204.1 hypothetical protein SAMN04487974_10384 [Pelagibacterium luteolum]